MKNSPSKSAISQVQSERFWQLLTNEQSQQISGGILFSNPFAGAKPPEPKGSFGYSFPCDGPGRQVICR